MSKTDGYDTVYEVETLVRMRLFAFGERGGGRGHFSFPPPSLLNITVEQNYWPEPICLLFSENIMHFVLL